jgi:hypothetical protein
MVSRTEQERCGKGGGGSNLASRPAMSLRIAALPAAMSAAVLLLPACFGGGSEASAPGTTSGAITSPAPSPTTTAEPTTDTTPTETVTGLADVPTTTEVGTDVLPKSAPPWHKELSVCKTQSFSVVYNREIPAILVKRDDRVIAWAGLYGRDVTDNCRDVPRKPPASVSNEPPQGIYESVELVCNSPGRIQLDVHAIEMSGSVYGSLIYITVARTREWLISAVAVKDVEGRRVYVNDRYCVRA